jgi:predicted glutamine amidotransferase
MCRLIGFAAPSPTTLLELLGPDQIARFGDMSCLHRDGWGTAWLDGLAADGASVRAHRAANRGSEDADFARALEAASALARLTHLRWATDGLVVAEANTHPFLRDGIALAHNGSIHPAAAIEEMLSAESRASLRGTTDSERYLALVLQEARQGPDLPSAVCRAVVALRQRFPEASLNALVLGPDHLVAVHASALTLAPLADLQTWLGQQGHMPDDHLDNYFLMRSRRGDDGSVIFSSTGLLAEGWEPLAPESVTVVELASLRSTVLELLTT